MRTRTTHALAAATVAALALAPAAGAKSLRISSLRVKATQKSSAIRRSGIHLAMHLASGTQTVRISIYRRHGGRFTLAARALRVPGKGGAYAVRLNDATVRKQVSRVGRYVVEVTPGGAGGRLSESDSRSRDFRVIK